MMKVTPTELPGVLLIEPRVFSDDRGYFFESYQEERYRGQGIGARFVQDNQSHSVRGVLRGMHFQLGRPQAKLVSVLQGEVYDVAVDVRKGSPTFGRWVGMVLSGENKQQLFIPEGFAHGFYVMSSTAHFYYKCSDYYAQKEERGLLWNDPGLGIQWPAGPRILAPRDAAFPRLRDMEADLPRYTAAP